MAKPAFVPATSKQLEILTILINWVEKRGFQPTTVEIAQLLGITKQSVNERLNGLAEKGYLTIHRGEERAISLHHLRFRVEFDPNWKGPVGPLPKVDKPDIASG